MINYKNRIVFKCSLIALFIVSFKWILSFYFYNDGLDVKIFFDTKSDGFYYYPFIKYFSDFSFNQSFDPEINSLKYISAPIHMVLFHTIFYKLFGFFSIAILQFIFLVIFFLLCSNIFKQLTYNENLTILFSVFIFFFPELIKLERFLVNPYLENLSFYNLRFPNQLVSNIFLFLSFFFLIYLDKKYIDINKINNKDYFFLTLLLSFLLGSYYYYFFLFFFSLGFFFIYKNNYSLILSFKTIKKIIFFSIIFFILSIPLFFNIYFVESDFLERLGIFKLDYEKKKLILNYLFNIITRAEFILIFILNIIILYFINKEKLFGYKLLNIFFIIFFSSIISPIIFFLISNRSLHISPFLGLITTFIFLNYFFILLILIRFIYNKYFNRKFFISFYIILLFVICFQFFSDFNKFKNESQNSKQYRLEFFKVTTILNNFKNKNKDVEILTLDRMLQLWAIMNNYKYIRPVSGQVVPKSHQMIEDDVFRALKFLNFSNENVFYFIKNIKKENSNRFYNSNIQNYFWHRYTANSLLTYKNTKDFDVEELNYINNSKIIHHQILLIPNFELKRLMNDYKKFKLKKNYAPDVLVLDNNTFKNSTIPITHCIFEKFEMFTIIYNKKFNECKN
jgi:hypothetical protein